MSLFDMAAINEFKVENRMSEQALKYEPFLFSFKVFSHAKTQVISDEKSCLRMYFKLDV